VRYVASATAIYTRDEQLRFHEGQYKAIETLGGPQAKQDIQYYSNLVLIWAFLIRTICMYCFSRFWEYYLEINIFGFSLVG
jgi:hypothetical protein